MIHVESEPIITCPIEMKVLGLKADQPESAGSSPSSSHLELFSYQEKLSYHSHNNFQAFHAFQIS